MSKRFQNPLHHIAVTNISFNFLLLHKEMFYKNNWFPVRFKCLSNHTCTI